MGEGEHEEGRTGHPGASGEGRYGGPPFRLESTYSIMGTCYRCEGEVLISAHYGPWCMRHNIERIERIDRGIDEAMDRLKALALVDHGR